MPIDPPDSNPPPKWTLTLVNAANARNCARGSREDFPMSDLEVAWKECGGYCAVSGMSFDFVVVGDGQDRHPLHQVSTASTDTSLIGGTTFVL